jgi:hypothetical protein
MSECYQKVPTIDKDERTLNKLTMKSRPFIAIELEH